MHRYPRIERLWRRRDELLEELARLPVVMSHGDFSAGNLLDSDGTTLALTGAGRVRWMVAGGTPVPGGYVDFVLSQAP
ncbi:hypothetical protein E1295_33325 [Nonomuraea mesophila]|uniref:Uncharacterized protein n=1 Tax=Nonomuraea mesophila TaxID=2530382 RepID=A0A4V2Z830_9ACTN|nr:hypothetical protein [Nonomuraea mesophila]TDE38786.1 hypothetical protein E1295_33325 [Nonomuraea mesophila]